MCAPFDPRPQVQVEDFKDAELMLDITEHTLVPEHQVRGD